jgi:hypothetical protein
MEGEALACRDRARRKADICPSGLDRVYHALRQRIDDAQVDSGIDLGKALQ